MFICLFIRKYTLKSPWQFGEPDLRIFKLSHYLRLPLLDLCPFSL